MEIIPVMYIKVKFSSSKKKITNISYLLPLVKESCIIHYFGIFRQFPDICSFCGRLSSKAFAWQCSMHDIMTVAQLPRKIKFFRYLGFNNVKGRLATWKLYCPYFDSFSFCYSPVRDTTWLSAKVCHLAKCRS